MCAKNAVMYAENADENAQKSDRNSQKKMTAASLTTNESYFKIVVNNP